MNWEALDDLVIDFAKSENLIEDSFSSPSPLSSPSPSSSVSSSSYQSRLIIRQIRRCLEAGDIDSAIDLLRTHAPFVLDDHRLLFRLQKQVYFYICSFCFYCLLDFRENVVKVSKVVGYYLKLIQELKLLCLVL